MTVRVWVWMAMARSGYHAVATWAFTQFGRPTIFYNHSHGVGDSDEPMWRGEFGTRCMRASTYCGEGPAQCRSWSVEDMDLSWVRRDDMTNLSEIKSASSSRFVMVLRDPYNWAASGYRKGHPISELRVGLWMKYARQATGEVDYFGIGDDARVVLYNHWFSDVDYRKEIAEWLDLPFTDEGLLVVPPFGLGSSFDLRSYNGRAQEMQVLDRWKVYADEPWFVQLFEEHPELEHYSKRLFGVSYL